MLRRNLPPLDAYLADAMSLDEAAFAERYVWPMLVLPEPPPKIKAQLSRPDTLLTEMETMVVEGDPTSPLLSGASLNALCLELRPRRMSAKTITIGRSPDADVILIAETISRLHAELTWDPKRGSAVLRDLGGKNGILVDDARVPPQGKTELLPGAVIAFGGLVTRYHSPKSFHTWLWSGAPRAGASPGHWPER
jgi:hypothetical protein